MFLLLRGSGGIIPPDEVRGSAPKLCAAYSRARCLPSPKGGIRLHGPRRTLSKRLVNGSRVDRDDFSGTLQIDTIGTAQLDYTLAVASADHCSNSVLP